MLHKRSLFQTTNTFDWRPEGISDYLLADICFLSAIFFVSHINVHCEKN